MSLQLTLPPGMTFKVVTFGQPRVGNQAFADYVVRVADFVEIPAVNSSFLLLGRSYVILLTSGSDCRANHPF